MKNKINQIVSEFSEFDDPKINWEYLKFKMRAVARNRSIELAKERREKRTTLESKVKKFLSMNELSIDETVEYESAKQELDRIYDHITDGCILRFSVVYLRFHWLSHTIHKASFCLELHKMSKFICVLSTTM